MKFSRRNLLRTGAAAAGGASITGALGASTSAAGAAPAPAAAPPAAITPAGTTLAGTLQVSSRTGRPGGYAPLFVGGGEQPTVRTDLGAPANPGREGTRTGGIAFAQLSDVHIVDTQSPLRLEFSDRLDDPSPIPPTLFSSAYRPHDTLTGHIADAMVRQLNSIGYGPITGLPLALTIQTGDNSDNSQLNEVRWNIDILDGKRVRINSGSSSKYEGVADDNKAYYDPGYYHPHGTPSGKVDDVYRKQYGFPKIPGLLDAARAEFQADGLNMEWYACFGNHDGLVQGNFPQNLQLSILSTGSLKLTSLPASLSPAEVLNGMITGDILRIVQSLALTPSVRWVAADQKRKLITRKQIVREHFETTGTPVGHGFTAENHSKGTAYYFFDKGNYRFVVMDTVNPNGYADGSIDRDQFDWLKGVLAQSGDKVVMVFSHHTSFTMRNTLILVGGEIRPRISGPKVLEELLLHDNVVAWINGHTHRNQVLAHTRPGGGGLWEINTAAHIDWPSQSRIIEIADNHDGTLSIFTTMVDHAGGPTWNGDLADPTQLAALAREMSANDPQDRTDSRRGQVADRNLELLIANPLA